jgi:hypothetical protein
LVYSYSPLICLIEFAQGTLGDLCLLVNHP